MVYNFTRHKFWIWERLQAWNLSQRRWLSFISCSFFTIWAVFFLRFEPNLSQFCYFILGGPSENTTVFDIYQKCSLSCCFWKSKPINTLVVTFVNIIWIFQTNSNFQSHFTIHWLVTLTSLYMDFILNGLWITTPAISQIFPVLKCNRK